MFFFIYLRKQSKCSANNNPFHYNQQPLQSHITVFSITNSSIFNYNKQSPQSQLIPTLTAITSTLHPQNILSHTHFPPFHHQSNAISLNKRPYSPQTFTNHPTFAILFICSQTQNKRAKTRPYVSFSPFMLHKFTQTSAFSICLPNYLTMQTHP